MREMIAALLLALGISTAHAQLGSVISSSSLPANKRPNSAMGRVIQKRNSIERDNLSGLKRCRKDADLNHFDCLKREISKLEKKTEVSMPKISSLPRPQASFSLNARFLATQLSPTSLPKKTPSAFKKSKSSIPEPLIQKMLSDENLTATARANPLRQMGKQFLSAFRQAKSRVLKIPSSIGRLVGYYAKKYSVDPNLALAMVKQESGGNRYAVSKVGAMGLGQLMPQTARRFGVTNPFDPRQNIEGMVRYLKFLQRKFHNDEVLMVAAYNSGEGRKAFRYGLIPRFHETVDYVKKVFGNYFRLTGEKVNYKNRIAPRHLEA